MDELPREAKAVLSLARDVHDPPDPHARERVQARLAAALVLAPGALASARLTHTALGSRAGPLASTRAVAGKGAVTSWLGSSKIMLAGLALALASGGGIWTVVSRSAQSQASVAPAAAPEEKAPSAAPAEILPPLISPVQAGADTRAVAAAERSPRRVAASSKATARAAPEQRLSLAQETALLARAADQLARHELTEALESIREHRRLGSSQLAEERDGLLVLAHCMQGTERARAEAKTFVARAPNSVLVARLERACGL